MVELSLDPRSECSDVVGKTPCYSDSLTFELGTVTRQDQRLALERGGEYFQDVISVDT